MGTVFEAEHLTLGRVIAVKVLHPTNVRRSVAVARFQKEARAAGTIGHSNICEVYDLGELEDNSPFLVMERLVGETFAERIAREGSLPIGQVVDVMMQVLSGLHAAHEKGILHRDIKPENIFLNARVGVTPLAKILDFGVAKEIGPVRSDVTELTQTGMVMGTPFYLAPEQARGERNLDQRTDIYACGVVLYEALTGRRPFMATNYNMLLRAILMTDPTPVREIRPDLPEGFEFVVSRAMARDRSLRFANAVEMQEALAPYHPSAVGVLRSVPPASVSATSGDRASAKRVSSGRSLGAPWDDDTTVYDASLPQQFQGDNATDLDLEFDDDTVQTNATSELARQMREQIRRGKP